MKVSQFQQAILDEYRTTQNNIAVNAAAGSGKSSTLELLCRELSNLKVLVVAFNKDIAEELKLRLPANADAKTIHSACYRFSAMATKGKMFLKSGKDYDTVQDTVLSDLDMDDSFNRDLRDNVMKGMQLCMTQLTSPDSPEFADLCDRFNVDSTFEGFVDYVKDALNVNNRVFKTKATISFTDMVYQAVVNKTIKPMYDVVMVDESQDLSPLLQAAVLQLGHRKVIVGDPYQSIYGFTGASPSSFADMVKATNAVELPLSVCYRCPASHLDMAREIVPTIQNRPDAIQGEINLGKDEEWLMEVIQPKDLIMCRTNAPLLSLAFRLLKLNKPVKLKGRDMVDNIVSIFKRMSGTKKHGTVPFDQLSDKIDKWYEGEVKKLERRKNSDVAQLVLKDTLECVEILWANALAQGVNNLDEFRTFVSALYDDNDKSNVIHLSSVHKAKGLEADNTFILGYDQLMPHPMATTEMAKVQEINLKYVAITRAKKSMSFINIKK